MNEGNFNELLLQKLEYEKRSALLYAAALEATGDRQRLEEWERCLEQSWARASVLSELCRRVGIDPNAETQGRMVVRKMLLSLVAVIRHAQADKSSKEAELIACECVCLVQTRNARAWALIGKRAERMNGAKREALVRIADELDAREREPAPLF